jgi:hypothetical protein
MRKRRGSQVVVRVASSLMGRVGVLLLPSPRKNRTSKLSKHPALANPERHQRLNTSSG